MWIPIRARLILAGIAALALTAYLVLIWLRAGGEIENRPRAPQPDAVPAPERTVKPEPPSGPPLVSESPPAGENIGERAPIQPTPPSDADRRPRRRAAERPKSPAPDAAEGGSAAQRAPPSEKPFAPAELPGPAPSAQEPSRTAPAQADAKPSVAQRSAAPQREKPVEAAEAPGPAPAPAEPSRTAPAQDAKPPVASTEPPPVSSGQGGAATEQPRTAPSPVQRTRSARRVVSPTPPDGDGGFKPTLSEGAEGTVPAAEGAATRRPPAPRRVKPTAPAGLSNGAPGRQEASGAAPTEADGGAPAASYEPPPVSTRHGLAAPKRFRAQSGSGARTRSAKPGMPTIGTAERPHGHLLRPNLLWRGDPGIELVCRCVVVGWRFYGYGFLLPPRTPPLTAMYVEDLRGGFHF